MADNFKWEANLDKLESQALKAFLSGEYRQGRIDSAKAGKGDSENKISEAFKTDIIPRNYIESIRSLLGEYGDVVFSVNSQEGRGETLSIGLKNGSKTSEILTVGIGNSAGVLSVGTQDLADIFYVTMNGANRKRVSLTTASELGLQQARDEIQKAKAIAQKQNKSIERQIETIRKRGQKAYRQATNPSASLTSGNAQAQQELNKILTIKNAQYSNNYRKNVQTNTAYLGTLYHYIVESAIDNYKKNNARSHATDRDRNTLMREVESFATILRMTPLKAAEILNKDPRFATIKKFGVGDQIESLMGSLREMGFYADPISDDNALTVGSFQKVNTPFSNLHPEGARKSMQVQNTLRRIKYSKEQRKKSLTQGSPFAGFYKNGDGLHSQEELSTNQFDTHMYLQLTEEQLRKDLADYTRKSTKNAKKVKKNLGQYMKSIGSEGMIISRKNAPLFNSVEQITKRVGDKAFAYYLKKEFNAANMTEDNLFSAQNRGILEEMTERALEQSIQDKYPTLSKDAKYKKHFGQDRTNKFVSEMISNGLFQQIFAAGDEHQAAKISTEGMKYFEDGELAVTLSRDKIFQGGKLLNELGQQRVEASLVDNGFFDFVVKRHAEKYKDKIVGITEPKNRAIGSKNLVDQITGLASVAIGLQRQRQSGQEEYGTKALAEAYSAKMKKAYEEYATRKGYKEGPDPLFEQAMNYFSTPNSPAAGLRKYAAVAMNVLGEIAYGDGTNLIKTSGGAEGTAKLIEAVMSGKDPGSPESSELSYVFNQDLPNLVGARYKVFSAQDYGAPDSKGGAPVSFTQKEFDDMIRNAKETQQATGKDQGEYINYVNRLRKRTKYAAATNDRIVRDIRTARDLTRSGIVEPENQSQFDRVVLNAQDMSIAGLMDFKELDENGYRVDGVPVEDFQKGFLLSQIMQKQNEAFSAMTPEQKAAGNFIHWDEKTQSFKGEKTAADISIVLGRGVYGNLRRQFEFLNDNGSFLLSDGVILPTLDSEVVGFRGGRIKDNLSAEEREKIGLIAPFAGEGLAATERYTGMPVAMLHEGDIATERFLRRVVEAESGFAGQEDAADILGKEYIDLTQDIIDSRTKKGGEIYEETNRVELRGSASLNTVSATQDILDQTKNLNNFVVVSRNNAAKQLESLAKDKTDKEIVGLYKDTLQDVVGTAKDFNQINTEVKSAFDSSNKENKKLSDFYKERILEEIDISSDSGNGLSTAVLRNPNTGNKAVNYARMFVDTSLSDNEVVIDKALARIMNADYDGDKINISLGGGLDSKTPEDRKSTLRLMREQVELGDEYVRNFRKISGASSIDNSTGITIKQSDVEKENNETAAQQNATLQKINKQYTGPLDIRRAAVENALDQAGFRDSLEGIILSDSLLTLQEALEQTAISAKKAESGDSEAWWSQVYDVSKQTGNRESWRSGQNFVDSVIKKAQGGGIFQKDGDVGIFSTGDRSGEIAQKFLARLSVIKDDKKRKEVARVIKELSGVELNIDDESWVSQLKDRQKEIFTENFYKNVVDRTNTILDRKKKNGDFVVDLYGNSHKIGSMADIIDNTYMFFKGKTYGYDSFIPASEITEQTKQQYLLRGYRYDEKNKGYVRHVGDEEIYLQAMKDENLRKKVREQFLYASGEGLYSKEANPRLFDKNGNPLVGEALLTKIGSSPSRIANAVIPKDKQRIETRDLEDKLISAFNEGEQLKDFRGDIIKSFGAQEGKRLLSTMTSFAYGDATHSVAQSMVDLQKNVGNDVGVGLTFKDAIENSIKAVFSGQQQEDLLTSLKENFLGDGETGFAQKLNSALSDENLKSTPYLSFLRNIVGNVEQNKEGSGGALTALRLLGFKMKQFGIADEDRILEKINNAMISGSGLKAIQDAFVGEGGVSIAPEIAMLGKMNGQAVYGRIDNAVLRRFDDEGGESGYQYDVIDYKTAQKNGDLTPENIVQIASYVGIARQNQDAIKKFFKEERFGKLKEKSLSALNSGKTGDFSPIFQDLKEFLSQNLLFATENGMTLSEKELQKMSLDDFVRKEGGEAVLRNFAGLAAADRFGAVGLKAAQGILSAFRINPDAINADIWNKIIQGQTLTEEEQSSLKSAAFNITGQFSGNEKIQELYQKFQNPLAFIDYLAERTKYKSNLFKYRSLQEQLNKLGVDGDPLARSQIEEQMKTLDAEMAQNKADMKTYFAGPGGVGDGDQVQATFEEDVQSIGKDVEGSFSESTLEKWQKMYSMKQEKMLQLQQLRGLRDSGMLSETDKAVIVQRIKQIKKEISGYIQSNLDSYADLIKEYGSESVKDNKAALEKQFQQRDAQIWGNAGLTRERAVAKQYLDEASSIYQKWSAFYAADKRVTDLIEKEKNAVDPRERAALRAEIGRAEYQRTIAQADVVELESGMVGKSEVYQRMYDEQKYGARNRIDLQNKKPGLVDKIYSLPKRLSSYFFSTYGIIRIFNRLMATFKQLQQQATQLDMVLTNLRIVTQDSRDNTQDLITQYAKLGESIGASTSQVASSAVEWLRQGYSISESMDLVKSSMYLSKLGMIDAAAATKDLTSALKGFKLSSADSMGIVDMLTALDLVAATSAGDIAEGLAQFANLGRLAGIDEKQAASYVTTITDVTQMTGSSAGQSMKMIISRFGNVKAGAFNRMNLDSEESGEAINDVEKVLKKLGISLRSSAKQFKDFDEVLDELADKWGTLDNVSKKAVAVAFAGVRQQEAFVTLMENYDKYQNYLEVARESGGTAEKKYQSYMDSVVAAQQQAQAIKEQMLNTSELAQLNIALAKLQESIYSIVPTVIKYLPLIALGFSSFVGVVKGKGIGAWAISKGAGVLSAIPGFGKKIKGKTDPTTQTSTTGATPKAGTEQSGQLSARRVVGAGMQMSVDALLAQQMVKTMAGNTRTRADGEVVQTSKVAAAKAKSIAVPLAGIPIIGGIIGQMVGDAIADSYDEERDKKIMEGERASSIISGIEALSSGTQQLKNLAFSISAEDEAERQKTVDEMLLQITNSENKETLKALNSSIDDLTKGEVKDIYTLLQSYTTADRRSSMEQVKLLEQAEILAQKNARKQQEAQKKLEMQESLVDIYKKYHPVSEGKEGEVISDSVGTGIGTGLAAGGVALGALGLLALLGAPITGGASLAVAGLIGAGTGIFAGANSYEQGMTVAEGEQAEEYFNQRFKNIESTKEEIDRLEREIKKLEAEMADPDKIEATNNLMLEAQTILQAYELARKQNVDSGFQMALSQATSQGNYLTTMSAKKLSLIGPTAIYDALAAGLDKETQDNLEDMGIYIKDSSGNYSKDFINYAKTFLFEDEDIKAALAYGNETFRQAWDRYKKDETDQFNIDRLSAFADALGVSFDGLGNEVENFEKLTLTQLMGSLSDLAEQQKKYRDVITSLMDSTRSFSEIFQQIAGNAPELLRYFKGGNLGMQNGALEYVRYLQNAELKEQLNTYMTTGSFFESILDDIAGAFNDTDAKEEFRDFVTTNSIDTLDALLQTATTVKLTDAYKDTERNKSWTKEMIAEIPNAVQTAMSGFTLQSDAYKPILQDYTNWQVEGYERDISLLEKQREALEKVNKQREYETKLIEAQIKLQEAQENRNRVYREGIGWVYEADQGKIAEAEKNLKEVEVQKDVSKIAKQIDIATQQMSDWKNMWQIRTNELKKELYGENGFLNGESGKGMSAQLRELLGLKDKGSPATLFADAVSSAFFNSKFVAGSRIKVQTEDKEEDTKKALTKLGNKYKEWTDANFKAQTSPGDNKLIEAANQKLNEYRQAYQDAYNSGYISADSYNGWTKGDQGNYGLGSPYSYKVATGGDEYKLDLIKEVPTYEEWADTVSGGKELNRWTMAPYSDIEKEINRLPKDDGNRAFLEKILRARKDLPKRYNLVRDNYNSFFDELFYFIDDPILFDALRTNDYSKLTEYQKVVAGIVKAFQQDQNATTQGVATYDDYFGARVRISQRVGKEATLPYFYGSGTLGVEESSSAIINELGTEAIITPSGTLTALPAKTGIVPADITKNVWQLGEVAPTILRYLDQIISRDELSAGKFAQNVDESFNISNLVMNVNADSSFDPDEFVRQIKSRVALTKNL